jgi:hypothetical protein
MKDDKLERFYQDKTMRECTEGRVLYTWSDDLEPNGKKGKAWSSWEVSSVAPMHLLFLGLQVGKIGSKKRKRRGK